MPPAFKKKKRGSTTNLPAALRDELGLETGQEGEGTGLSGKSRKHERAALFAARGRGTRGRNGRGGTIVGRKEMRKAQRQEKKGARGTQRSPRSYSSTGRLSANVGSAEKEQVVASKRRESEMSSKKGKERAIDERQTPARLTNGKQQQKLVTEPTETPLERLMRKQGQTTSTGGGRKRMLDGTRSDEDDVRRKRKAASSALTATERNEEDEIAWLEAHLGMGRGGGKRKKAGGAEQQQQEEEDGLDELLYDLDRFHPGMYDSNEDDGDDDDDESEEEDSDLDSASMLDEEEEDDDDDEDDDNSDDAFEDLDSEVEESEEVDDGSENDDEEGLGAEKQEMEQESIMPRQQEGRYIPPALRRRMEAEAGKGAESEELMKFRRSAKGILNRLGDNNIGNVVGEAEALYRLYSRAQTTSGLTNMILDTVMAGGDSLNETFVVLYGAFICSLHRIVGVEFGAHFVQELIDRFMKQYDEIASKHQSNDGDEPVPLGKETSNLAAMLAALYNLDVIGCPLVYDVIKLLLGNKSTTTDSAKRTMSELDVELLLQIVKACGTQLRHDDPTSLKSIVHLAHERQRAHTPSLRAKFMLESLSDLRNNRSRATTANAATEMVAKMRKFLGGLGKKHTLRTLEPLRVGLHDLLSVEKRGKWWLVGAAWSGYEFGDAAAANDNDATFVDEEGKREKRKEDKGQKDVQLLALARQHGMNTVLRQQIFVTLLSSDDYLDAVQRLLALMHKKPAQRREIVRVLLHCLGVEANFNPFYVVVCGRLSSEDWMATRVTLQYCLWDFLRRLGERDVGGQSFLHTRNRDEDDGGSEEEEEGGSGFEGSESANVSAVHVQHVARAYGWWMAKDALGLDALRAVDFTLIKRRGKRFVQLLFLHLFLSLHVRSPAQTLTALVDKTDKEAVERVFVQGTRSNQRVAKGILVFFETHLQANECRRLAREIGLSVETTQIIVKARSVALETVRIGARVAAEEDGDETMRM